MNTVLATYAASFLWRVVKPVLRKAALNLRNKWAKELEADDADEEETDASNDSGPVAAFTVD